MPLTRPVVSNMTILGPAVWNAGSLSTDFLDGVVFNKEGRGAIYNSVVTGGQGILQGARCCNACG
jgi:hypothetical protein